MLRLIHHRGVQWHSFNPGEYQCTSGRVSRNICGTWNFFAFIGHRGKRSICQATGLPTMRAAMNCVHLGHERKLQANARRQNRRIEERNRRWHESPAGKRKMAQAIAHVEYVHHVNKK